MSKGNDVDKVGKNAAFYKLQNGLDTIVFVHGIRGHYKKTWDKFPELLERDPDLPCLDIFLWGYKTGVLRPLVHDTQTLGRHFVNSLETNITSDNSCHLVGHSMGGLVILEGLVQEMLDRRAQAHPVSSISFISLFASPVSGSTASAIAKNTVGKLWVVNKLINKQIRSLARGERCDTLIDNTCRHIYHPDSEDTSAREIPIRMIMATRDGAVTARDRNSTKARFCRVRPKELDFEHSNIKSPDNHRDERYRALTNDLQEGLAKRFQSTCEDILADNPSIAEAAKLEFHKRYEKMLNRRFIDSGFEPNTDLNKYHKFLRIVIRDGAQNGRPPFDTANRAIIVLSGAGRNLV